MTKDKQRDWNLLRLLSLGVLSVCLCAAVYMALHDEGGKESPDATGSNPSTTERNPDNSRAVSNEESGAKGEVTSNGASVQSASGPQSNEEGPSVTRSRRRDNAGMSSTRRKTLVDPIASWKNPPPWPEGPRMFAEVETSSRKYVNLRPDDAGELPRIYTAAEERIELRVNFPEGTPGEKIFVEIPNGGTFPDTKSFGRVYELP